MRKWFVAAVNVLLGGIVLLIWRLQTKAGQSNYDLSESTNISRILVSFTVLTFLALLWSLTKKNKEQ